MLRTFLKPGTTVSLGPETRIILEVGMDSMDTLILTDMIEKEFCFRMYDFKWNSFWSDSEVTLEQLCDFVEYCLQNNKKKHSRRRNE